MNERTSIMVGLGLAFLAWYLIKGRQPSLTWRINPVSGNLEPVPVETPILPSLPTSLISPDIVDNSAGGSTGVEWVIDKSTGKLVPKGSFGVGVTASW